MPYNITVRSLGSDNAVDVQVLYSIVLLVLILIYSYSFIGFFDLASSGRYQGCGS